MAGAREGPSPWQDRGRAPLPVRSGNLSPRNAHGACRCVFSTQRKGRLMLADASWRRALHPSLVCLEPWPSRVAVAVAPEMAGNCKRLGVYIHKGAVRTHLQCAATPNIVRNYRIRVPTSRKQTYLRHWQLCRACAQVAHQPRPPVCRAHIEGDADPHAPAKCPVHPPTPPSPPPAAAPRSPCLARPPCWAPRPPASSPPPLTRLSRARGAPPPPPSPPSPPC